MRLRANEHLWRAVGTAPRLSSRTPSERCCVTRPDSWSVDGELMEPAGIEPANVTEEVGSDFGQPDQNGPTKKPHQSREDDGELGPVGALRHHLDGSSHNSHQNATCCSHGVSGPEYVVI